MKSKSKKFEAKTEPKDAAKGYEASRELQLKHMKKILPEQSKIWSIVKKICSEKGIQPLLQAQYYAFASELYKKLRTFKGKLLLSEAVLTQMKWMHKGLNSNILSLIGHAMGIPLDPSIEIEVTNWPTDYPDAATLAELILIYGEFDTLFKVGDFIGNTGFDASNLLNPHPVSLSTLLNPHPVSLSSIPNPSNLDVALSLIKAKTDNLDQALSARTLTKHDNKVYLSKVGRINATALLSIKVAEKIIKVHSYALNSESDSQTAYSYEETSGTQLSMKWPNNTREGVSRPFAHAPAQLFKTATAGKDLGLNLANNTYVNYEIQYSVDDAS